MVLDICGEGGGRRAWMDTSLECTLLLLFLGSNTHNNGAPGGDGQTGDAGEGTGGRWGSYLGETLCVCAYSI